MLSIWFCIPVSESYQTWPPVHYSDRSALNPALEPQILNQAKHQHYHFDLRPVGLPSVLLATRNQVQDKDKIRSLLLFPTAYRKTRRNLWQRHDMAKRTHTIKQRPLPNIKKQHIRYKHTQPPKLTEINTRSASLMASSILVEKKRFFPRQDSTTSFNPGWKKQKKRTVMVNAVH